MLAFVALIGFAVASVADVPSPRPTGWVSDQARVLDREQRQQLDSVAEALRAARGIELAIVTVDDVPGTPKQFATDLFKTWGIGSAQTNNGVLVLLVIGRRRIEVETGTGIEAALTAEWLSSMQADTMVPRFKAGDLGGGLLAGVRAIDQHIREAPAESTSPAASGTYRSNGAEHDHGEPARAKRDVTADPRWGFLIGAGGGALGIAIALGVGALRRRRICLACVPPRRMEELDEVTDDAHLDSGQQTEERLGSVNYIVLLCPGCRATRTLRKRQWAPQYQPCPSCKYKTLRSTTTIVAQSTYSAEGEVEVTDACSYCDYVDRHRYETARLLGSVLPGLSGSSGGSSSSSDSSNWLDSDTSSSWSSSDSSSGSSDSDSSSEFSGGDSHGGGAGSSW